MVSESRSQIVRVLEQQGFRVSPGLPEPERTQLRPLIEIATRLIAVKVVGHWVANSEEQAPAEILHREVERLDLRSYLDDAQRDMLATERTAAQRLFLGEVGWAFEGAWSLAWILGYEDMPDHTGQMMDDERVISVLVEFAPPLGADLAAWVDARQADGLPDVAAIRTLEDYLYCVHNAARSALLGHDSVPPWFHPVLGGGVVQERRRALTWALTPGCAWADTDLST